MKQALKLFVFYDRHLDVGDTLDISDTLDIVYMPSNPKINRSNKTISKHN